MLPLKTPQEWIAFLADGDSFVPLIPAVDDQIGFGPEVLTGFLKISGKTVGVFANDMQVGQGYVTSKGAIKIRRLMDRCLELGIPLVGLLASPGVSIEEGLPSGDEYSAVLMGHCELSGVIPQFAGVMGVNIGAPAYSASLMDLSLFQKARSYMCVSGPGVVAQALGEKTTYAELGGAMMHAQKTGMAHFVDANTENQLSRLKWLIDFFPSNYREDPEHKPEAAPLKDLPEIPSEPEAAFDMATLIAGLVDRSESIEYSPDFGPSMMTCFARLGGHAVGLVANQSLHLSGALDADASQKCARFVRICDAYNIPILTLIDAPGFMPGSVEEQKGLLRQGALLCQAMCTRVVKMSVTVRKCYGASAIVLGQTRKWRGDLALALDTTRAAVMGFQAAKHLIYKDELGKVDESILKERYRRDFESPEIAYQRGLIDQIVKLKDLRSTLIQHLNILSRKRDKAREPVRGIAP